MKNQLEVQRFLNELPTNLSEDEKVEQLTLIYDIRGTISRDRKRVILNYGRLSVGKICDECRQLILEVGTWKVIGKSMPRFHDILERSALVEVNQTDELRQLMTREKLLIYQKLDGTIFMTYYYNHQWLFATRKTFIEENEWIEKTREILRGINLDHLDKSYSYVFELVAPFNRIITKEKHGLYLLSANSVLFPHREILNSDLDKIARLIDCQRPARMNIQTLDELLRFMEDAPINHIRDVSEGYVAVLEKDGETMRLKIKYELWYIIHNAKGRPDTDTDVRTNPITRLTKELFLALKKFPDFVKNELTKKDPFLLSHELCQQYLEVSQKLKETCDRLNQFREEIKEVKDRREINKRIVVYTDVCLERHILYSHFPIESNWDVDRNKIKYLNQLIHDTSAGTQTRKVEYQCFIIFGDHHTQFTQDIDVAIIVKNSNIQTLEFFLKELDLEDLREKLTSLGYDTTLKIDSNMIMLTDDGDVTQIAKGGKEIQNMIYYTYGYHKQMFECPIKRPLELDLLYMSLPERCGMIAKFVMDHIKALLGSEEYQKIRAKRIRMYKSGSQRVDFANEILNKITLRNDAGWQDAMKSLTMKIIQLMILEKNQEICYTKLELAKKFGEIHSGGESGAIWLLTRGNMGEYSAETVRTLFREFATIADAVRNQLTFSQLTLDEKQISVEQKLLDAFKDDPIELTDQCVALIEIKSTHSLNGTFIGTYANLEHLPIDILERTVKSSPRSKEWLEDYRFYNCGSTTSVTPYYGSDWVRHNSHLLSGIICETMVIDGCDFSQLLDETPIKIQVGLIVEKIGVRGCRGCAPDLILKLVNGKLVIVEIKRLIGKPLSDNGAYRRAINLGKRQLALARTLIGDNYCTDFGIIAIIYVHKVDVKYQFDLFGAKIKFST